MKIMIKEVGRAPRIEDRESLTLADMQELVGGYIECLSITDTIDMWLNEEGKLDGLPTNLFIENNGELCDCVVGDVFFASHDDEGETVGLSSDDESKLWGMYNRMIMCRDPYVDGSKVDLYCVIEIGGDKYD